MPTKQPGRCPDCGKAVLVVLNRGAAAPVPLHACTSRACQQTGCGVKGLTEVMVQMESGDWYCPCHALQIAAHDLVTLYRVEGEADWAAISEVIGEVLPDIIAKIDRSQR